MYKSIGVITHYYNSTNYGGLLQSYALCRYLNSKGVDAKQVCFDASKQSLKIPAKIKLHLYYAKKRLWGLVNPKAFLEIRKRNKSVVAFRNGIPHTNRVYTFKNLYKLNDCFDAFITGSDQVWNPISVNEAYSLSFSKKPNYSYAASVASETIPDKKTKYYEDFLKSFKKVSVRERNAKRILPVESTLVLDPVFLVSADTWRTVASPRLIKEPYVFCYFLGDSIEGRKMAVQFAHENNLKVVNIPYLKGFYRKCDDNLFDYSLSEITPNDFLSLIMNAEYVFTDSFHAICFSYIYKKSFFVFDRPGKASMNTRIEDILFTLDLEARFIADSTKNLNEYSDIDYSKDADRFSALKQDSENFISSIIRGSKDG